MSDMNNPPYRSSWGRPRTHDEPLAILVPPHDLPLSASRFSPESPPLKPSRTQSTWTSTTAVKSSTNDTEAALPRSPAPTVRDRLTRMLFELRTWGRPRGEPELPMQQPRLQPWQPLHIEKRHCCEHCPQEAKNKKKKRRRRIWLLCALAVLQTYLLANVVVLNVQNAQTTSAGTKAAAPAGSSATVLSAAAQQCLSEYDLNAPTDPATYPCATCLPVLQAVPSDFSDGNAQDAQQIVNAVQFCGLRSVFDQADGAGQSALTNSGWVQDVRFCAWGGVACDGSGRVSSLQLTFPSVPASLTSDFGSLTGLQSLKIVGDTNVPAGSLPSTFANLTSLTSLDLESTAISALPDGLFSSLSKLTTLSLVKNTQMGPSLPASLAGLSLQNLVINDQVLSNPLSTIAASATLQSSLKLLDLSSTALNGSIPASIASLSALGELHLDGNELVPPLPPFPTDLQTLTLTNNTGLSGSVTGSFCALGGLEECDVRGTGLSAGGSCGVCQFS